MEDTGTAIGLPVIVGPIEATAAGDIIIQTIALGDLAAPPTGVS